MSRGTSAPSLAGAARTLQVRPPILVEIEQRHHADPIAAVFDDMQALRYDGWALFERGLRPLSDFDVARDQERFLTGGFQDAMPRSYVNDSCSWPGHSASARPDGFRGRLKPLLRLDRRLA